ncbi:hypothetical protein ACGF07_31770 [Kitasatospora sp. NPDC048194]|uniref:hypothetical protein n=1 Tax=Kitasatospora sp. NPDC048194 TaxID=3364045 RepID=UPI00371C8B9E
MDTAPAHAAPHQLAQRLLAQPWPEWLDDRPAVVVPQPADRPARPMLAVDGWSIHRPDPSADPAPGWEAVLDEHLLTVTRPGGETWFTGQLPLTREWRRSVRNRGEITLISGPFGNLGGFTAAATSGQLQLVTVAARFAGGTW